MRLRIYAVYHRLFCLVALGLCCASVSSWGACLPLPSADLQSIDRDTEDNPDRAIASVEEFLRDKNGVDLLRQAELYLLLAEARGSQSRPDDARAAITTARGKLAAFPADPRTDRLRLRLALLESILDVIASRPNAAIQSTDRLLVGEPNDSLERACILAVRAQAWWFLNHQDHAVADGLGAYRIAHDHGWTNAGVEAASALARIFKRAGLYEQAEEMMDEIIAAASRDQRTSMLSTGKYERGLILLLENRFSDARAAFEESRRLSEQIGDQFGVAVVNVPLCWSQVAQGDLNAAEQSCYTGEPALVAAQRPDLLVTVRALRASIDLGRGRPAAALEKLNKVLAAPLDDVVPAAVPRFYRDRAQALAQLHRYPEAYADLRHAWDLDQAADVDQRNRGVAVLSALVASEKLLVSNRLLMAQLSTQRLESAAQQQARRLWATVAVGTLILCLMIACMLLLTRRHSRALRRQEAILLAAGHSAPDALVLLDEQYKVRFANRNLFGSFPIHPIHAPLGAGVPAQVLPRLTAAIEQMWEQKLPITIQEGLRDEHGRHRQFDVAIVPALADDVLVGVMLRSLDVTEVRQLEREVIDGVSREQRRLSSDLHEGLGQELAGIMLMLGGLSKQIKQTSPEAAALADQIAGYVAESIVTTRELARGLSPVAIGRGSLVDAFVALATATEKRLNVRVTSNCKTDGVEIADTAADHLYRIGLEAITNSALHGRCTKIDLQLRVSSGALQLSVADDGCGISPSRPPGDGLGIRLMAYRSRLLGGDLHLGPNSPKGTLLVVVVPVSQLLGPHMRESRD